MKEKRKVYPETVSQLCRRVHKDIAAWVKECEEENKKYAWLLDPNGVPPQELVDRVAAEIVQKIILT
jgi:hypothetical protein